LNTDSILTLGKGIDDEADLALETDSLSFSAATCFSFLKNLKIIDHSNTIIISVLIFTTKNYY